MAVPFITDNYRDVEVPINYYPAADQDKEKIILATPGLNVLVNTNTGSNVRKFREMGDYLYVLSGNEFGRLDTSWNYTVIGTVGQVSGPAFMEMNGYQVCICDGSQIYVYNATEDTFGMVTDEDNPGATSLTYQDGYGIFINPNTDEFYLTALYDFTSIDALDYASAEGWPDKLTAVLMSYRELWLVGPETLEIWQNTGAAGFPFERNRGTGFAFQGTEAPGTMKRFNNGVILLNQFRQVIMFQGYQPHMVSTEKMVREMETYSNIVNAVGWVYAMGGHEFYGLTFPDENVTWVYDAKTNAWHKRQSMVSGEVGRWLGHTTYYKPWNGKQIVGGRDGKIYEMSRDFLDEEGQAITRTLYSQEIRNAGKPINFRNMQILFNHGIGAGINLTGTADPQAALSWSSDGGRTYSNEIYQGMGKIGEYSKQSLWTRLGIEQEQRIFKLVVSGITNCDVLSVDMV